MKKLNIAVAGVSGRMGRMLVEEVLGTEGCLLAAASERAGGALIGQDVGVALHRAPLGLAITGNAEELAENADAILDFTAPESTLALARLAAKHGKTHVIGTTGLSDAQKSELQELSRKTRIVFSPNMSLGVNLLMALVEKTAELLGPDYDIEILEMHHRHKVDAPSGTALGLGEAAQRGRRARAVAGSAEREASFIKTRDGITGERARGDIGFATLRGGDVIGDHTVMFAGLCERIELTHKASSRQIYARGAVKAALWAQRQKPGLYTLKDVLGL